MELATSGAVTELRAMVSAPFDQASAIPPQVYTCPEFNRLEVEQIFAREWMCVGRASSLAEPGDFLTYELAGQPVIVIRDGDGQLRAMSNVCLHRMSTLLHGNGNTRSITCPYHGWTYNLDGSLRGAPLMQNQNGFDRKAYCLPAVRCEEWLGWIYISLNSDIEPVHQRLEPLRQLIERYGMEHYTETFYETHVWDTNWKLLAENFMESYHLPVCHQVTVGPHSKLDEVDCPDGHEAFNYHWFTKEASLMIGNAHPDNQRLTGEWRRTTALVAIYPSHLITLTPGYFWYLTLHPRGTGQVHITYGGGMSPEFMADPKCDQYLSELKELLDEVNVEDRKCTERVYHGVCAGLAQAGPLCHLERPIYDFARYLMTHTAPAGTA